MRCWNIYILRVFSVDECGHWGNLHGVAMAREECRTRHDDNAGEKIYHSYTTSDAQSIQQSERIYESLFAATDSKNRVDILLAPQRVTG